MKLKNLICLLLVAILAFASIGVSAAKDEEIELFTNGGCEIDSLGSWDPGGNPGCGVSDAIARTGKYSFKLTSTSTEGVGAVMVANFEPFAGATYTFDGWVYVDKKITPDSMPEICMIFRDVNGQYMDRQDATVEGCVEGKWYNVRTRLTAPEGCVKLQMHARMVQGGTYYWDDCSVKASGSKEIMAVYREKLDFEAKMLAESNAYLEKQTQAALNTEMIEGTNLLKNSGFEEGEDSAAKSWNPYNGGWGAITSRTDEEAHKGSYSIKIDTRGSDRATYGPYADQKIFIEDGLVPEQTYVFSAWVKVKEYARKGGVELKIEPYSARRSALNTMLPTAETDRYTFAEEDPNGEQWHLLRTTLQVDAETKMLVFLIDFAAKVSYIMMM